MAHSDKKVIFKRPDGTIAILMPVDSCPLTFDEIIAKDDQKGYKYKIFYKEHPTVFSYVFGDNNTIEDPWTFKLFDKDCGDLEQYIPVVIPHLEGHSFYYYGMIMHQMILGDNFKKGDDRITFQGHGLKCDGIWRLWW